MFFLVLVAHPKPTSADYGVDDGGYAACWANAPDAETAELQARVLLSDIGWESDEVDQPPRVVERGEYAGDPTKLAKFDQALIDGVVITLNTWPVGAPDEESPE